MACCASRSAGSCGELHTVIVSSSIQVLNDHYLLRSGRSFYPLRGHFDRQQPTQTCRLHNAENYPLSSRIQNQIAPELVCLSWGRSNGARFFRSPLLAAPASSTND